MPNPVSSSGFRRYVRELRALTADAADAGVLALAHVELAHAHLDGRAGRELRRSVSIGDLRRLGAFFTGERLAAEVSGRAGAPSSWRKVVDPACGCGDLLLAAAWALPVTDSVGETLAAWGRVLHGADVVPEFVEVTRQRLMLQALLRGGRPDRAADLASLLPGVAVGDGRQGALVTDADVVLLNPPYGQVPVRRGTSWASGLVTEAAMWVADVVDHLRSNARLVALLPEVLRSGARYERWRGELASNAHIRAVQPAGRFDAVTDIDVFLLVAERHGLGGSPHPWPVVPASVHGLGDSCRVMVGPVVDRRDPEEGPLVPYLTSRELPQSGEFRPTRLRRFSKRLFEPPFVVVRRTSRPTKDEPRLRPVVVRGKEPVAVENHLLVIEPPRKTLEACQQLASDLRRVEVTNWLNCRIRLRHLTVSALREVPA